MSTKNTGKKISLQLLKRLVAELETALELTDEARSTGASDDLVVAYSKAYGMAAGVAQEATLLASDIVRVSTMSSAPAPTGSSIDDLLKAIGKPGGTN